MNDNIQPEDFTRELTQLLNRYSAEAPSGTPDFILAAFMRNVLREFNEAVSARAEWRGEAVGLHTFDSGVVPASPDLETGEQ